jgi:nucleoside-diphosphate-sugar epimerase
MHIAITGATGFLGRYIVERLAGQGHTCRCWFRPTSDRTGFGAIADKLEWLPGELGDAEACRRLVEGCAAVVHAGLYRVGAAFRGGEGDLPEFVQMNVVGTIQLIEAARRAGVQRFVFISSCSIHEKILDDRPLDETHPLWPLSHYGAHKAAIEKFVHSYGFGHGYPICALRPTGIYGATHPVEASKWYDLVRAVARGDEVRCESGGKEVHAADVAAAVDLLLKTDAARITGEAFACCDRYISEYNVATIANELCGGRAKIVGGPRRPKHEIVTDKIRALGMTFGGEELLARTIRALVASMRRG